MDKVIESKQKKLKHFSERYCAIEAQITKLKKQQKDIENGVVILSGFRTGTRETAEALPVLKGRRPKRKSPKTVFVDNISASPFAYLGEDAMKDYPELSWSLRLEGKKIKVDGNVGTQRDYLHVNL
jgi:hypothetical protein